MRALIACLLWLVGVEVMPAAHLALHDAASHHHDGEQIVADHGDEDHHDVDREVAQDELDHPEHDHGGGGLAHHATALAPPPRPPAIASPSHHVTFTASYVAFALVSRLGLAPSARGPPRTFGSFT